MTVDAFPFPKAADFEQKEPEAKPDQVRVIRHVRPARYEEGIRGFLYPTNDVDPTGGVTFLFEIDYPANTLTFSAAACHPEENFNYAKANDKVAKMFENGCTFVGEYDRSLSLVDNAYNIFKDVYNDGLKVRGYTDFTLSAIGGQLDYALQRGAYDPAYVSMSMSVRIPIAMCNDFEKRVSAIINEYNAQEGEKAA